VRIPPLKPPAQAPGRSACFRVISCLSWFLPFFILVAVTGWPSGPPWTLVPGRLSPPALRFRPDGEPVRGPMRAASRLETPLDVPAASLYPIADLMPGCNGNGMRPRRGIRANDIAPPEPSSRGPVPDAASMHGARSIPPREPSCPRAARRRDRPCPDLRHRTPMRRAAPGMAAGAGDPSRRAPRLLELKE
jgi:hypothetical protein